MTIRDYACVIHGNAYDWVYVERLYNMLRANSIHDVRLHVFTESNRAVPQPFIKHGLQEWPGISGPKKSWWYKMQMFDPVHNLGRVVYLDLDTAITGKIDWIWNHNDQYFWAIKDFKHLWRPSWNGINSSVMIWDTQKFAWIWDDFCSKNINATVKLFHGDQDYLNSVLDDKTRRFFNSDQIKSWRWQCKDGGLDMRTRTYHKPNAGTVMDSSTSILIFHGKPKPHELQDPVVDLYWKVKI